MSQENEATPPKPPEPTEQELQREAKDLTAQIKVHDDAIAEHTKQKKPLSARLRSVVSRLTTININKAS